LEKIALSSWDYGSTDFADQAKLYGGYVHYDLPRDITPFIEKYIKPLNLHWAEVWTPNYVDIATAKEVKENLDSLGVEACTIFNVGGFCMTTNYVLNQIKATIDAIKIAKIMGPECHVTVQGGYNTAVGWTVEQGYEAFLRWFKPLVKIIDKEGVNVNFECAHQLFNDAKLMLKAMKDLDSPNIGINYDAGVFTSSGEQGFPFAFDLLQDYIRTCHFHNQRGKSSTGERGGPAYAIGYGPDNYDGVLRRLKEIGFNGPIILEAMSPLSGPMAKMSVEYVRARFKWPD